MLLHPDDGSVESWTAAASVEKMREDYADFEPRYAASASSDLTCYPRHARIQKLLSHVRQTLNWRLMDRQPLETWIHSKNRAVLLGDACHPMLVSIFTLPTLF